VLFGYGLLSLATLALMVYCVLNVITTPDSEVRNLPKPLWLMLCLLFPAIGGIAWLLAGRPVAAAGALPSRRPGDGSRGIPPEYDRPGRAAAASPEDDEAFLRRLRERAEAQRRAAEEQRRAERAAEQERSEAERRARRRRLEDGTSPEA
jgi:hypothetical protein